MIFMIAAQNSVSVSLEDHDWEYQLICKRNRMINLIAVKEITVCSLRTI